MLRMNEGSVICALYVIKVTMPFEILKGCYFGLKNLNFIDVGRKVQRFPQNMVHKASRCRQGKYSYISVI
jgi:hypothetical protein